MTSLLAISALAVTAPLPEIGPAIAAALASGSVFDGGGQTYSLSSQHVVEAKNGVTIRNATIMVGDDVGHNPASPSLPTSFTVLGFDRCTNLRVEGLNMISSGRSFNLIGFAECTGVTMKGCEFTGGIGRQAMFVGSNNVTIEENRFVGKPTNTRELLYVASGHPWFSQSMALSMGYTWQPDNRWRGGENRGSWIGDFESARLVNLNGTSQTATISWQNMYVKNPRKPLTELEWRLFWPGMDPNYKFSCTSFSYAGDPNPAWPQSGTVTVKGSRFAGDTAPMPAGQAIWFCFDPNGFAKNITVRNNTIMWNQKWSGMSFYWVDGFVVEGNSVHDNHDYGLGAEFCRNGVFRNNVLTGNQWMGGKPWNQIELVGLAENIVIERNLANQVGVVGWSCPQTNIRSDARINVREMPRNWIVAMTDPTGPILRPVFGSSN